MSPGFRRLPREQSPRVTLQPIEEQLSSMQTFPGMGNSISQPILGLDGCQKEQLYRPIIED